MEAHKTLKGNSAGFVRNEPLVVVAIAAVICLIIGTGIASILRVHVLFGLAGGAAMLVLLVIAFAACARLSR